MPELFSHYQSQHDLEENIQYSTPWTCPFIFYTAFYVLVNACRLSTLSCVSVWMCSVAVGEWELSWVELVQYPVLGNAYDTLEDLKQTLKRLKSDTISHLTPKTVIICKDWWDLAGSHIARLQLDFVFSHSRLMLQSYKNTKKIFKDFKNLGNWSRTLSSIS